MTAQKLEIAMKYLWNMVGTVPYKLGGNVIQDGGLDCSALMLEFLRAVGLWGKTDARAQDIYNKFKSFAFPWTSNEAKLGTYYLMFFGKSVNEITHISLTVNNFQMIEAGGTDKDGMVRVRPTSWRSDCVAFVPVELLLK